MATRLPSKMMGIAFKASPSQEVIWTSRSRTDQSPTTPVSRWSASVSDSMESWKADHSDCTRASRRLFASLRGCVMAPRC